MGGTFKKMVFSDRDSDYPARRKLIKIEGSDNIYDVTREEGTVRNAGTPWDSTTMNTFQNNIDAMFPVSIANGGTGSTTVAQARTNLGLSITQGTFSDSNFFSDGRKFGVYSTSYFQQRATLISGYNILAKYYRIANLVNANMYLHKLKPVIMVDGFLAIGPLPFLNSSGIDIAATVSEFSIYKDPTDTHATPTDRTIKASGILRNNERFIRIFRDDGGIAYPTSAWFTKSQQNILDATLSITYPLV